ncbi:unnamed protein product [Porites evermanni]|uniref:Uncharacterized protein n=1 Tax=Porites evermanni TaxID=104178 RepID=A0ABN8MKR4_9CNID|nr:unnamed protein product [Porites evermanni]
MLDPSCGGVLTNSSGLITTPNYPNDYPNNISCTWQISPGKTHLNLTIEDFMLEDSQTCQKFDFLKIEFKVGYNRQHVTLCGQEPSRQVSLKIDGTEVKMIFHSDTSFAERGFKISYRAYDIDPCLEKNGDCSHLCNLVKGKRICSCPSDYKLKYDGRTCQGAKSCYFVGYSKCPYSSSSTCKDLPDGKTRCECWRGYKEQNGKCQDIDECKEKPGRCGVGTCWNYRGWFSCRCPRGYRHNGSTCTDIDECKDYRAPDCGEATCLNTPGSYVCQCAPGHQLINSACQDIDECSTGTHGCDHMCRNTKGSYICRCRPGHFLDSDGKSCRAVRVEGLGQVQTIETCQGESLVLDCKDEKTALVIFKAVYSNFDSNACPRNKNRHNLPYNVTQPQCAGDVTSMIKNLCGWRRRCDIVVSSTTIGELCTDSYKLTVLYSCGKPLTCKYSPPKLSCPATEKNECTSDESCHSSKMCCFNGCIKTCVAPSLYSDLISIFQTSGKLLGKFQGLFQEFKTLYEPMCI